MGLLTLSAQEHAVGLNPGLVGESVVGFKLAGQTHGNLGSPAFTFPPGGFGGRVITGWV